MNAGVSDELPPYVVPSPAPAGGWYRCGHIPIVIRRQFPQELGAEEPVVGPLAGYFDPERKRTTYYAVYWRCRSRWVLVDLRAGQKLVLTDNGARTRLFQRFDTLVAYIAKTEREGL
jgi:hypothetical protein